ncbi:sigma-70 family RNA polymerase sigma factor [Bacillus massiliigorillae]|uniref:sigma-70 family RNA polymerase sigma factor n=1 Tax=Bacillus massiliigorillae TaxID=1243664 RepID=UPI00039CA0FF|nr:sigma-70 family RNA polymerase sigma factor [Bacillus massiliigorillae]
MDLDEVFKRHVNDVYRYLFSLSKDHYLAEDLVQEAFYRAYVQLEDYQISNIKAWLFKVAYHAFVDYKRKHQRVIVKEEITYQSADHRSPENAFLEKESYQLLLYAIHSLPEKEKHVILLCDLHGLAYKEAAEILNMKLNTLKSHLFRGRKKAVALIKELKHIDESRS